MTRTPRIASALLTGLAPLLIALALVLAMGASTPTTATLAPVSAPEACHEDMACWDCATMGNGVCGPVNSPYVDPTLVEVSTCTWLASGDVTCTWWAPSVSE